MTDVTVTSTVLFSGAPAGIESFSISSSPPTRRIHSAAATASSASSSSPLDDSVGAVQLSACNATDGLQKWSLGVPAAGYLSAVTAAGSPMCLNVDGCGSTVITYTCITTGGTCCGANCYENLQWAYAPGTGALTSPLNGQCLTWGAVKGAFTAPCSGSTPNQPWGYAPGGGQQQLVLGGGAGGLCLSLVPVPPPAVYAQVCGRIVEYNGGAVGVVPG